MIRDEDDGNAIMRWLRTGRFFGDPSGGDKIWYVSTYGRINKEKRKSESERKSAELEKGREKRRWTMIEKNECAKNEKG